MERNTVQTAVSSPVAPAGALACHPEVAAGLRRVESQLRRLSTSSRLPAVNAAAGRITMAGGKRLRPALTLAAALALGGTHTRRVVTAASCVELIHTGSLVHDDLMDSAARRRGARTLNDELGDGQALVVGDFILARASLAALVSVNRQVAETLGATVVELAEGQYEEAASLFDAGRSVDDAMRSITGKTASLFRAACVVAAQCARATPEQRTRLALFGERFGLVFQLLDDLLDLAAGAETLGKPAGNDLRQGVYTVPLLWSLDDPAMDHARGLLGRPLTEDEVGHVLAALRRTGMVERTLARCRAMIAETPPPGLPREDVSAALAALPAAYVDWAAGRIAEG